MGCKEKGCVSHLNKKNIEKTVGCVTKLVDEGGRNIEGEQFFNEVLLF